MSKYALFISSQRLKKITSIDENVEGQELIPFAVQAQDIYIQDALGTTFYNHLRTAVSGSTATDDEKTLINEYIAPTLANYTLYLALPSLNYKVRNKALLSPSSEESINVGLEEVKYLREATEATAEFYAQRLIDYLCVNESLFPTYQNPNVDDGMLPNHNTQYDSGLYIPSSNMKCAMCCEQDCVCNVRYL